MPDTTTIDRLQIEVESTSENAAKKIDALAEAVGKLKSASTGNFNGLKSALDAINRVNTGAINEIANSLKALKESSSFKLNKGLTDSISELSGAMKAVKSEDISRLGQVGRSLRSFEGLGEIKLNPSFANNLVLLTAAINEIKEDSYQRLNDIAEAMKKFGSVGKITIPKDLGNNLRNITDAVKDVSDDAISKLDRLTSALQKLSGVNLPAVRKALDGAEDMTPKDSGKETKEPETQTGYLESLGKSFEFVEFSASNAKIVLQSLTKVLGTSYNVLSSVARAAKDVSKSFIGIATSALSEVFSIPLKNVINDISNVIKKVENLRSSLIRIFYYRAIRTVIKEISSGIKEGIENLSAYSRLVGTTFHESLDQIATDALYIKNSLATIAEPILNALVPAFDAIADAIANAANMLARFLAMLTGASSYMVSKKHVTEYGDAISKAGAAAKEAKKHLLGIDELNIFDKPKSGGGGSGFDAEDYKKMFEEVSLESEADGLGAKLREAFENQDWIGIGTLLAGKLNEIVRDWDAKSWGEYLGRKIDAALKIARGFLDGFMFGNLGGKIAKFFNGLFESIDPYNAGQVLVAKFTSAVDVLTGFIKGLNADTLSKWIGQFLNGAIDRTQDWLSMKPWKDIGAKIGELLDKTISEIYVVIKSKDFGKIGQALAEMLNGAVTAVNFERFGRTLTRLILAVYDNILSFINNFGWGKLGQKIADFLNGSFAELGDWLDKKPFDGVGKRIGELLNSMITGIHWKDIGNTIGRFLIDALNELSAFVNTVDWEELGRSIGTALSEIPWGSVFDKLAGSIFKTIKGMFSGFFSSDVGEDSLGLISGFTLALSGLGLFLASKDPRMLLITGIGLLVTGLMDDIVQKLAEVDWGDVIFNVLDAIAKIIKNADIGRIIKSVGLLISSIIIQIPDIIAGALTGIVEIVSALFDGLADDSVTGFLNGIANYLRDLHTWLKENWVDPLIKIMKDLLGIHSPSTVMAEIGGYVVEGFENGILTTFSNIATWVKEHFVDPFVNAIKSLLGIHSPSTVFSGIGEDVVQGLKNGVIGGLKDIYAWLNTNVFSPIWNGITGLFGISGNSSSKMQEVGKALSEGIAKGIDSGIQSVKNALNSIISIVESAINWMINKVNSVRIEIPAVNIAGKQITEGKSIGFHISPISIPRLATGGYAPEDGLFYANSGELVGRFSNGRTAVANNEQITDGIAAAVYNAFLRALSETGGASGGTGDDRTVNIYLDGRQIAQSTTRYQRQFARATGG